MDKYIILLPMTYNDGKAVPKAVTCTVLKALYDLASGYTIEGKVRGAFRMRSGGKQEDTLLKVWVLIPSERVRDLKNLVRQFCVQLGQESIWLEKTISVVEFVGPASVSEDSNE